MISCVKDMLFMLITAKNSFSIKKINLFFEKRNAVKSELTNALTCKYIRIAQI